MPDFDFHHLKVKTFRAKKEGPHLLILAGVHGNEYEPVATAIKLLDIVPDVLSRGMVSIVPVVNEPAFKNASRYGEDGLDLARTCPGNIKGTTTEIIAAEVSELIAGADYLIDLHTGGDRCEIAPFAGYTLHPSEEVLHKQFQMARAFRLKTIWGTTPNLDGRTLSVARDHNIPAIYAEYGGGGGFRKEIVQEYVQGCLNVLIDLGLSEGTIPSDSIEYIVKDYREESGNLRLLLPAPADGFFESKVNLCDVVEKGVMMGTITDPFGQYVEPIRADQDGMVFLLRTIPSVREGDSLGGIWPITKPGEVVVS